MGLDCVWSLALDCVCDGDEVVLTMDAVPGTLENPEQGRGL